MIDELERIWKEMIASKSRYYLDLHPEGQEATKKTFQNGQCLSRVSKRAPP
jgi:hypothetical protein